MTEKKPGNPWRVVAIILFLFVVSHYCEAHADDWNEDCYWPTTAGGCPLADS